MADSRFHDAMAQGYGFTEPTIVLGGPMLGADVLTDVKVQAPLSMMNRHGLVAGATGTGKTKTLQIIAGELSDAGVPSFIADVKGDVTGIAQPGDPTNPKVQERATQLGWTYKPEGHPVEFLSLSGKLGAQVRATVHSFGAVLLGKVMDLNETQTSGWIRGGYPNWAGGDPARPWSLEWMTLRRRAGSGRSRRLPSGRRVGAASAGTAIGSRPRSR